MPSSELASAASSETLSPLSPALRSGIIAMSLIGLASFLSCGLLFLYITYRLLKPRWTSSSSSSSSSRSRNPAPVEHFRHEYIPDLPLSASRRQLSSDMKKHRREESEAQLRRQEEEEAAATAGAAAGSNSSLTLIHNLLMADMLQAFAFIFGFVWWRSDGIFVPSSSCEAQAFFINLGSVSISLFLIGISLNTFLAIVWGYKLSRPVVRSMVALSWVLSFVLAFIGLGVARSIRVGPDGPWYYARSNAVCWINRDYVASYGFWLQNIWLVASMGTTIACYAWIFVALLRNRQSSREMPPPRRHRRDKNAPPEPSGHHPAFLVYPAVYILSSGPITLAGLLASAGVYVGTTSFVLATALSSLAGLLDAVLWSTTILFSSSKDLEDVGLATFDFMRTPSRLYGNMIWVEGATRGARDAAGGDDDDGEGPSRDRKWWRLNGLPDGRASRASHEGKDIDDNIILMDTVTSVTVDVLESGRSTPSGFGHNISPRR